MRLLVCIPTLTGRERYLANCLRGYRERSPGVELMESIIRDAPTCGIGWQRCVDQAWCEWDYVHFSNDDIVVGEGWLAPLIDAVDSDFFLPVSRIEPAGVHLGHPMPDPIPMPPAGDPISLGGYFYSDLPENQPTDDFQPVDHGSLPFCTRRMWDRIGPFIPSHFGTDKWFYERGRETSHRAVAIQRSIIYNYAPQIGRARGDWTETDFLDFDLTISYPMYVSGALAVDEPHPLRETPEGLRQVREWRARNFG